MSKTSMIAPTAQKLVELGQSVMGINQLKADLEELAAKKKSLIDDLVPYFEIEMAKAKKKTVHIDCGDSISYTVKRADYKGAVHYPTDLLEEMAIKQTEMEGAVKAAKAPYDAELEILEIKAKQDPRTTQDPPTPRWSVY